MIRAAGGEGLFTCADMRIERDVEAMVAETVKAYGRLDCAVNNAGVVRFKPIAEETEEGFNFHIDVNLRGVFFCMKRGIRQMRQNGGGAIVNQSSITGSLTGNPAEGAYAASKRRYGLTTRARANSVNAMRLRDRRPRRRLPPMDGEGAHQP